MKYEKTCRGFDMIKFVDRYGTQCSLQKSSLGSEDAIWLGVDDAAPKIMAYDAPAYGVDTLQSTGWVDYPIPSAVLLTTRMHLTQEQVAELLPALQRFAATGELSK